MAFRIVSHHRTHFTPACVGGSSSILTKTARRALTYNVSSPKEFDEKVLQSKVPVLVDFHASWCQPCKALTPILQSVMETYEGKVDLAKVDVDELQDLALEYDVMSVPTVLALKDGNIVDQFIGMKQADDLQIFIQNVLSK